MFTKKHMVLTAVLTFVITAAVVGSVIYFYVVQSVYDRVSLARDVISEYYVDPLTEEQQKKMEDYAISAMVASLEDPYSYYFDETAYDSFEENNEEEYVGVGVSVTFHAETEELIVIAPTDGSPAQKAGILPGDVITKVDDIAVTAENHDAVIDHIRGDNAKKGTSVRIYVLRGEEQKEFEIARDVIPLDTVSHKMLDEHVGYIRVSEFKHGTVEEFSEGLAFVQEKGAEGLIIDLRNNPGGYADSVIRMTDMLLPKGTIAYLEDNKGEREYFYSDAACLNIPMVILVNEGTASAAELLAGSTQAHGVAKIVGKKTFGKAVGQRPYMLSDSTAVYLTDSRYYTPKGECIDKKGIQPDVEVDLPEELKASLSTLEFSQDEQLRTAMEVLYDSVENK